MKLLQFSLLQKFPELFHGISNRHTESLVRPTAHVDAEQIHSNHFAWVTENDVVANTAADPLAPIRTQPPHTMPGVDALLTSTPGVRLRVGVSDCTPIIVYEPHTRRGGVIHAGFKGTSQDILYRVLQEFYPARTYVCIGPAIGPCCYDNIDIQSENEAQALEAGVPSGQIEVIKVCTRCNVDTYFSFRGGDTQNFSAYFEIGV